MTLDRALAPKPEKGPDPHEKVAPTAWYVAKFRAGSDIPYAKEIADELEASMSESEKETLERISPKNGEVNSMILEARHKLLNKLISENEGKQVLELASGLTSRGLEFTEDPSVTYVETDLGPMIRRKEEILENLEAKGAVPERNNLYFETANVLNFDELKAATSHFKKGKPITVVNEGLLRYLSLTEKKQVARNIRRLLEESGGTWITSDITLTSFFAGNDRPTAIQEVTGIKIEENGFESFSHADKFFSALGFTVEQVSFVYAEELLTTPQRLGKTPEEANALLSKYTCFVMRPIPGFLEHKHHK